MNSLPKLAVICPVYNEAEAVPYFFERMSTVRTKLLDVVDLALVFVNNASSDDTLTLIRGLREHSPWVQIITQSRNFGYQASVLCGIRTLEADAYVVIDVDCEDPPELIASFVTKWQEGYDLVYGERVSRPEHFLLLTARRLFYLMTRFIADSDFILYMAEFALFSRRIRHHVVSHHSTFPFVRSDLAYAGFRRFGIPYAREPRRFGRSHYNIPGMFRFAIAGQLSASTFPLRAIAYFGFPLALADFCLAVLDAAGGHALKASVIITLNLSFIVSALAFTAIYLARVSKDVVGRPTFIVDRDRTFLNQAVETEVPTLSR